MDPYLYPRYGMYDQNAIDESLSFAISEDPLCGEGIRFGYTNELCMLLYARSYYGLKPKPSLGMFSDAIAQSMQDFAQPFECSDTELCYPHFLLHGIKQERLEDVTNRIDNNVRSIHETLTIRKEIKQSHGYEEISDTLQVCMTNGCIDDFHGLAYLIARNDAILLSSANGYIAKCSFLWTTKIRICMS